jgi:hypothetical protein
MVLKIYRDGELINVQQFMDAQVVIGRSGDAQVTLEDATVSAIHALLEERDTKIYLSDLGSQTGTYLSGKRVLESEIKSGEEIKIGPFTILFFVGVPKPVGVILPSEGAASTATAEEKPAAEKEKDVVVAIPPPLPEMNEADDEKTEEVDLGFAEITPVTPVVPVMPQAFTPPVSGKTYAPPSVNRDPKELVQPGKGQMVEVVVFWHERVIATHHFNPQTRVQIGGSRDADVFVPTMPAKARFTFVKMSNAQATVCLTPDMDGELVRFNDSVSLKQLSQQNKLRDGGDHYELDLKQGEMVRVSFMGGVISLVVRYKESTVKPLAAPLLDLTTSEVTGVILAIVISSILGLYMWVYAPATLGPDEAMIEEPLRKAIVKFNPPTPVQKVAVTEEKPVEEPKEKQVVKVPEKAAKPSRSAEQPRQTTKPTLEKSGAPGKAAEVAPSKKPEKNKAGTSKSGGSVKTAQKEGANAKSKKPDPTKSSLLSAFGAKGVQDELNKAYSGSGELTGLANQATGTAGFAENRPGEGIGSNIKEGASGKGESIVGISGVGTKGRGTGTTGYGTGGIGKKGAVDIGVEGEGAGFVGSIDKEAIRRVIRAHLREIRTCYERALQRQPDLYGKVVFSWVIAEKGRVQSARVTSSDSGLAEVADCIKTKLQTWTFPEPPPNTLAEVDSYPFVFASQ